MFGPNCQSCGMPLSQDENGGGTNADGSSSQEYCSFCYANGKFRQPEITVEEMQALSKGKLQSMHFPGFIAGLLTKGIPKLKRWSTIIKS